jgi:DNA-binding response OmpR family regulator
MAAVLGMLHGVALEVCVVGASGLAGALREPPDLFLLDTNVPDANGVELLRPPARA